MTSGRGGPAPSPIYSESRLVLGLGVQGHPGTAGHGRSGTGGRGHSGLPTNMYLTRKNVSSRSLPVSRGAAAATAWAELGAGLAKAGCRSCVTSQLLVTFLADVIRRLRLGQTARFRVGPSCQCDGCRRLSSDSELSERSGCRSAPVPGVPPSRTEMPVPGRAPSTLNVRRRPQTRTVTGPAQLGKVYRKLNTGPGKAYMPEPLTASDPPPGPVLKVMAADRTRTPTASGRLTTSLRAWPW